MQPLGPWQLDLDDPRAPTQEVWDQMSESEREAVVNALPSEFVNEAAPPPEGDPHVDAWTLPRQTLRRWSRRSGRKLYVAGNMAVYYPEERMFSPDLFAVADVEDHDRDSWIVSKEHRGLDLALEVVVAGRRRKDFDENAERYARLGIKEYFIYDWRPRTLTGRHLSDEGEPRYQRIVPQAGRLPSHVLGLDLFVDGNRIRFAQGDAIIPDTDELVVRLEGLMNDAAARAQELEAILEEEQRKREEEQRKREEEQRKREDLEQENAALREELAKLRGERDS